MKIVFVFLSLVLSTVTLAQKSKIKTITIGEIATAYVDRPGDLYVQLVDNSIKKFDRHGKLIGEYNFEEPITTFDPRDGARMFVYLNKSQQCSFFSQETKQTFPIEEQYAVEPVLVCASGDRLLWILDRSDWSLKKIDPSQSKVITEAQINRDQFKTTPEIIFMREYQNFLFLIERNQGILIFNSLGMQINKIEISDIEYFNFLGEELYFKSGGKLKFYDLFDASTREISIDPGSKYILLTDISMFSIFHDHIDFYEVN